MSGAFLCNMTNEEVMKNTTRPGGLTHGNGGRRYDVVLMNPPYSDVNPGDGLYINFLIKSIQISNVLVSVNPGPVILGHGSGGWALKNKVKELRDFVDELHPDIEQIKNIFDAGLKSDVIICKFDNNNIPSKIHIKFENGYEEYFDNQEDIKNISSKYLIEFYNKLKEYFEHNNDNVFKHIAVGPTYIKTIKRLQQKKIKDINKLDRNKLYVFLYSPDASFDGTIYKSINRNYVGVEFDEKYFKNNLFVTFDKDKQKNSGYFCQYMLTDFIKLVKKLCGIYIHAYTMYDWMPWLDFSKEWTDEELFNIIGMEYNKEEINKILNGK